MTTILLPLPSPPPNYAVGNHYWQARPDYLIPRAVPDSVELPSIRQVIPEFELRDPQEPPASSHQAPQAWTPSTPGTSLEYIHSPTERSGCVARQEECLSVRSHQTPRLYPSPERTYSARTWPVYQSPSTTDDSWRSQAPSHYRASVSTVSPQFGPGEYRHSVHGLSALTGSEGGQGAHYADEYASRQRTGSQTPSHSSSSSAYGSRPFDYASRYHRISAGSSRAENRSSFSTPRYSLSPQNTGRYNERGVMVSTSGEEKPRKRRGNLPKATTDRLRSWFVAHLQHPYPTEDEKQCLMRQTGLQMNQISNWFINARRRQLPAMINNARAETNAMHNRASGRASVGRASIGRASIGRTSIGRASIASSTDRSDAGTTGTRREST